MDTPKMDTNDIELEDNVDHVLQLIQRPMKKGEIWYLVDKKWFELFELYLQEKDAVHNPGPIDNSALFKSAEGPVYELRERLEEESDYQFIPEEGWQLLVRHFGISDENQVIKRPAIEPSRFSSFCSVEVYPRELKLCLFEAKEDVIVKPFSRITTLGDLEKEMRRLFNVDQNTETQLWSSGSVLNPHNDVPGGSPSDASSSSHTKKNDNQTLNEGGLSSGAIVALEVRNGDGTWPSSYGAEVTRSSKCVPGLCGLINLGHTCFMNTALQCLSNTMALTTFVMGEQFPNEINHDNPLGMGGEIAKIYAELIKTMWSGYRTCLAPREFKQVIGRFALQFSGFSQQDCQELIAFLLDGLHEDLNRVRQKPYIEMKTDIELRPDAQVAAESWENYKKRNDSIIVDTFHSLLKSTLVCPECALVSVTFDPFCYLSLPLPIEPERPIDIIFVPQPQQVENNDTNDGKHLSAIQISRLSIPKYGVASDICSSVAKVVNESGLLKRNIDSDKLVVADVYYHRFHKLYYCGEAYNGQLDEVVVYETREDSLSLPVYLREIKGDDSFSLFGRPFFISLNDANNYDSVSEAISQQLKRYLKLPSSDEESDSDEGVAECDSGEKYSISMVNSAGSMSLERLDRNKPLKLNNKCYLAVDFPSRIKSKYFNESEMDNLFKLPLQKSVNSIGKSQIPLSECIASFNSLERLGADDPWYCPRCNKHQMASKKFDLWTLPKVLIIHLKRFSYSWAYHEKLDILVDFPLTGLDMGEYVLNNQQKESMLYDLIAVANHDGGLGSGAYYAYAKNVNTQSWHSFTDSNVSDMSEESVVSKSAYVLFYQRRE